MLDYVGLVWFGKFTPTIVNSQWGA